MPKARNLPGLLERSGRCQHDSTVAVDPVQLRIDRTDVTWARLDLERFRSHTA